MCSICGRVDTFWKTAAAVEGRLQAWYDQCSSLERQICECSALLKKCVTGELEALKVECAQFMGDLYGELSKDLVHFLTGNYELLDMRLGKSRVLEGHSAGATKASFI